MNELDIFAAALEIPTPEARGRYLDEVCGGDPDLRRRVNELLAAHAAAGSFMDAPAQQRPPEATAAEPVLERPGAVIDSYKLLEEIGEGGFGVVFMAEQTEPVRRRVALKILKPGMDTRQVVARFEAERQALAIMDHPNIAKIHDGGATPSGRPYFVMELVKGVPITEFCDRQKLTPRQRLELFMPVCQAVQHAHQKGIIHRDLKPSNVLVVMHDSTAVPKVIDFGIAKALGQELTDKTVFTGFAQMVGTPLYMSPEQAGQSCLDIDTRSDIYSLGVLLYELLTSTTPFDKERFKKAACDEIRRIIREEEPPKPSTRPSDSKDSLPSVSAQRQTEPAKLTKLVRGELDWIVMKALEKDRNRRYETANGFAMDVQRYLADEPVQACPPSVGYRLRKFARRNKRALCTAGVLALVVLSATGTVGWMARDAAARQREQVILQMAREQEAQALLDEAERLLTCGESAVAARAVRKAEGLVAAGPIGEPFERRLRELLDDLQMLERLEEIRLSSWDHSDTDLNSRYQKVFSNYGIEIETLDLAEGVKRIRARTIATNLVSALDHWVETQKRSRTGDGQKRWKSLLEFAHAADIDDYRNRVRKAVMNGDGAKLTSLLNRGNRSIRGEHAAEHRRNRAGNRPVSAAPS